jgi:hypothetical protein
MRYGVLADVHANLHALEAALAFLATEEVDAYLCAGDLVGYGPQPNECVRRVLGLPATCVAGNHDLIALGELSDEPPACAGPAACWTTTSARCWPGCRTAGSRTASRSPTGRPATRSAT